MITKIDEKGLALIIEYEGLRLKPYLCSSGVPTIGYGSTYYSNGTRVTMSDTGITTTYATQMLHENLKHYEDGVNSYTRDDISQNQFNALTSFAYNCGLTNLKKSTLLKLVNLNPLDPSIEMEFMKWSRSNGKIMNGLLKRRCSEWLLYNTK